jgi:ribosomal protein L7/L12
MAKVLFKGCEWNLQKISLTKLFRYKMNLPLKIAKSKTDALLDGETFIIETESFEQAEELVKEATAIGAVCEIIKDND